MDFTPSSGGGSYEQPKVGTYTGILVGFSEIGTQTGGAYGPKKKVVLRWELHKRKGPSLDAAGHVHTITARYNVSFNEKASLRAVVEKHIGLAANGRTSSHDWLGKAAKLTLTQSDDGKWTNVDTVAMLDPEEDEVPKQIEAPEHWEIRDGGDPPVWAKHFWEKSQEFAQLNGTRQPVGATAGREPGEDDNLDIPY